MRVFIDSQSDNFALSHHIQKEGDEVVLSSKDADMILPENLNFPQEWHGLSLAKGEAEFYITRIFDGQEFGQQWLVGVPFVGLMNARLGANREVGSVIATIEPSEDLIKSLQTSQLLTLFRSIGFIGPVSWVFNRGCELVGLISGMPSYGVYALMEMIRDRQKICSFYQAPMKLHECWSSSILLTRAPWPFLGNLSDSKSNIISDEVEKHLWLFNGLTEDRRIYSQAKKVGLVTSWSIEGLIDLSRRVQRTLWGIELKERQFRGDIVKTVISTLDPLLASRFLTLTVRSWSEKGFATDPRFGNDSTLLQSVENGVEIGDGELVVGGTDQSVDTSAGSGENQT